ncbi:MAG: hypothetical protein CSA94_01530 [Bacteroidetes bacterium]|nr:MAG: hypothetical protein CSA94_01530 [Bacteroidota bacterium]
MKAYYKDHAYLYQAEESTREIEYVVFPIEPNAEDSAATYKQMEELRSRFYKADDDFKFVQLHSEENIEKPYFTQADVPGGLGATVFENKEIGYISDIFSQDTSYLMFKVDDFITIPDSVKASHILITPDTARGYQEVFTILDSLRTEVKNGANFAELAKTWSMGPSAPKGGDLGWFKQGAMVPEFNDACFYGKIGDYPIVATQFGIHLIKIEKQNGGQEHAVLAIVEKHITASTNSYNKIYADASNFASQNNTKEKFDQAVIDNKMVKKIASNIKESDQKISGLNQARSIIKWAFNNELASISNVEEMPEANCFIVAKISQIREKGTIDFEYVKDEIKPIVIRKKKAEMLKEKINNNMNSDINAMASSLNAQVETAQNISFNSFSIPKLGIEPNVISAVAYEPIEKVSKPIEGNNAIYVVEVTKRSTPEAKEDFSQEKTQLKTTIQSRVNYEMMKALKKASKIEDKRSIFF